MLKLGGGKQQMNKIKMNKRNNIGSTSNHNSDINHISDSKHKCHIWE